MTASTISQLEQTALNEVQKYISNKTELAMIMAHMCVESASFTYMTEIGYKPARAYKVFPKYFKSLAEAELIYAKGGSDAIFDRVYGGRMGNTDPKDGSKYKGRGPIAITGKYNYAKAKAATGIDYLNKPELMADTASSIPAVVAFWNSNNIGPLAKAGNVREVTKKINGGFNGLTERERQFKRWKKIIGVT